VFDAHWVDPEAKPEIKVSEKYQVRSEDIDLMGYKDFLVLLEKLRKGMHLKQNQL